LHFELKSTRLIYAYIRRCKRCTTSSKRATFDTSACPRAGPINVRRIHVLRFLLAHMQRTAVHAMQNYAITHKLTPFISMQNHYNLIYREEEREMFPTLKLFGVGSIPWSPLARGLTTRPVADGTTRGESDGVLQRYNYGEGTKKIISA
jgi:Aldo/keto reductase family